MAVPVLHDAFLDMSSDGGLDRMAELFDDFNCSLLHFLANKAVGATEDGAIYYAAESARPLNVTNAGIRILASAVRLLIEP